MSLDIALITYFLSLWRFLADLYRERVLLSSLVRNDFRQRYIQNYLGIIWAFLQPALTILMFWVVFDIGFKSQPVQGASFVFWLLSGILPWFFLSDAISSSTDSIFSSSFLVKKIVFKVHLLPVVKLISALIIHSFFVIIMLILFILSGYPVSWYWLQLVYYLAVLLSYLLGIAWITSSVTIFFPDLRQLVAVFLQFGFYLTPIFWSLSLLPESYHILFKLNPFYYIVQGYRDSLIEHIWFWQKPGLSFYNLFIAFVLILSGGIIFRKLKPHFADVL